MSSRDISIRQLWKTHKPFLMMRGFVWIFCSQKKRRVCSRQASLHLFCTVHNLCSGSCRTCSPRNSPRLRQELNDQKLHKKDPNASKGAQVCPPPPPLKYLPLQFFTNLVSYLVEDVLHVLSALERPNAVDEAAVLKL